MAPGRFRGVAIAINLDSRDDVDAAFEEVRRIGGEVVEAPVPTDWGGYVGYFADPDRQLWEVAHNPSWPGETKGGRGYRKHRRHEHASSSLIPHAQFWT